MNVLVLSRGKESPLAYPTLLDDLAAHNIHASVYSTNVLGILLPTVIARRLRHGDFDVIACTNVKMLEGAKLGLELTDNKDVKIVEWPDGCSVANVQVKRKAAPAVNFCLVTDIYDAREAVSAFAKTAPTDMRLHVLGTGKARLIMPAVQLARKHRVDDRIDWLGDSYDIGEEMAECSSFYTSNRPLNHLEASLSAAGVPCVNASNFGTSQVRDDWQTAEFHVKHIIETLRK